MSQVLNEIKLNYEITTREGVHVTITGVPTRVRTYEGQELQTHSMAVAMRLEALVRAVVAQDQTPGRSVQLEFA
jgi:hypothetical protein